MSVDLGPDPRLQGKTSAYNRDEVVRLITEFYQFLTRMPFIEPEDILYPPPAGWPNITSERFAPLGKDDTVIDLLAHLPYIRNHGRRFSHNANFPTCLWFQTFALNYTDKYFQSSPLDLYELRYTGLPPPDSEPIIPPHVAVWTEPEAPTVGHTYLIDTMDGTITEYPDSSDPGFARYSPDDPRSWRNECERTMLLSEFLDEWKRGFLELNWIPYWQHKRPHIYDRGNPHRHEKANKEGLYEIMISYGWPHNFKRRECKAAMLAWRIENERTEMEN